jgi:hypothetical protein
MRSYRTARACLALSLSLLTTACSSNLNRFDVINTGGGKTSAGVQVTRAEAADQGSGTSSAAMGPGAHTVTRVTLGGSYLRRLGTNAATGGHSASAGLHARPGATQ